MEVPEAVPVPGRSVAPGTHYDRVTEAWTLLLGDELHYGVFRTGEEELSEATAELTRLMIDASRLESGMEVLDVGSGTGAPACRLAAEHGVRVTGITTSAVGVRVGRAHARGTGVAGRVSFEQRDGMDNGFETASFDRVWVLESSHLMRDRYRLVAECARVLRPNGRVVLCDIVLREELPFSDIRRLREPLALLRDVFGDARMEPLARYAQLFEASGLDVREQTDLTAATAGTFARWRENAQRHHDYVAAAIGPTDLERFVEATAVLERLWTDGVLGYGLIAASKLATP
jgi:27-O-demethylrifamycin SV methyltransferase